MGATFIQNRCFVKRIKNTTDGLINGIKPNLRKLHTFKTICYAYIHGQKKLHLHSLKSYFVGYDK